MPLANYAHLEIARTTCLKLVMRHFAPSPTSEARRCSLVAACGLRRARRIAAIRFSASCLFISLKDIVFTEQINTAIRKRRQILGCTERAF